MNKRITNKTESMALAPRKRIAILGGVGISALSLISLLTIGFSTLALIGLVTGGLFSVFTYVIHHISSGAYLPAKQEKSLRQKLISLKFKLSDEFEPIIESAIQIEKKICTNEKLLTKVLQKFFNPGEVTFKRYYQTGSDTLHAIQANLELIVNKLETLQNINNAENKKIIHHQVQNSLQNINELFDSFESLIMSFEACDVTKRRDEIFEELEELAKRTKKYINI